MNAWELAMQIEVLDGVVSGVTTGLVLAVFFWAIDRIKQRAERKEQIRFLGKLISTYRERIYEPQYSAGDPVKSDTGKDIWRKVQFEDMKKEINLTLDGRCSRLSFDEINELRQMVNSWSEITDRGSSAELVWTDTFCGNVFGEIGAIQWLNLPTGPDFYQTSKKDDRATKAS